MNSYIYEEQVLRINKQAIEEIKQDNYEKSLGLLKQALIIVKKIQTEPEKSRILTQVFNTLGNLFKKTSNLAESMKFFLKSVDLERNLPDEHKSYVALAYLNLCTLYSQSSDHRKSLKFGTSAVSLLKKLVKFSPKLYNSLVIAYYNLANEYKALGDYEKAEELLRTSLTAARETLGPSHDITETVSRALKGIISKSPDKTLKNTQKFIRRSVDEGSVTKFPEIIKKRSGSDDKDYYKNLYMKQFRRDEKGRFEGLANLTFYKDAQRKKVFKTPVSEEESTRTDKSVSANGWYKRFDVNKHKETEKAAAIAIQSWWRGIRDRRVCVELKIKRELKMAENKAKKAIEEYEKVKLRANRFKKQQMKKKVDS